MSGLFGSKPKDYVLRPGEVNEIAMNDWQRNNPNVVNPYGSSTTTFNGNQAEINQSFSPELQGLFDKQIGFLQGGPQQMGDLSNPFLEGAIGNAMESVYNRTGQSMPSKPMQGGAAPNPGLSFGYGQEVPGVTPQPSTPMSQGFDPSQIGTTLENVADIQGGYGGGSTQGDTGLTGLTELMNALDFQKKRKAKMYGYEDQF